MANRPGGNNPYGRNQYTPRAPSVGNPSLLTISVDVTGLRKMVTDRINSAKRIDGPVLEANTYLAQQLQEAQQGELLTALYQGTHNASGRARPQYRDNALAEAIISPQNRFVNVSGFTVGRLDEIPHVRDYWRGLEYGSRAHVGRFLPGYFVGEGGRPVPFDATSVNRFVTRRDLLAAGGKEPRAKRTDKPGYGGRLDGTRTPFRARIQNEIQAIHFQREGFAQWQKIEGSATEMREVYAHFLKDYGIDFGLGPGRIRRNMQGDARPPIWGSGRPRSGRGQ